MLIQIGDANDQAKFLSCLLDLPQFPLSASKQASPRNSSTEPITYRKGPPCLDYPRGSDWPACGSSEAILRFTLRKQKSKCNFDRTSGALRALRYIRSLLYRRYCCKAGRNRIIDILPEPLSPCTLKLFALPFPKRCMQPVSMQ